MASSHSFEFSIVVSAEGGRQKSFGPYEVYLEVLAPLLYNMSYSTDFHIQNTGKGPSLPSFFDIEVFRIGDLVIYRKEFILSIMLIIVFVFFICKSCVKNGATKKFRDKIMNKSQF